MVHRFKDDWLLEDGFQGWLVKVSNDDTRAYCRYCAIVLRAQKSDLSNHGGTHKHAANAKIAEESGNTHAPISVQIVCNDNEDAAGGANNLEQSIDDDDTPNDVDEESVVKRSRNKYRGSLSKSQYKKKYRPEWEDEPHLKDWLQAYPSDSTKAYCKACGSILRAHKHDLACHARSKRHITRLENGESTDISTFEVSRPAKLVKASTSASDDVDIDDGMDHHDIQPDDDDHDSLRASTPSPVKVPTTVKSMKRESPKPYSRKRAVKINAADVLIAIDNNEFTGYELLQMVKRIVPKL